MTWFDYAVCVVMLPWLAIEAWRLGESIFRDWGD
jgi:hypothetical protein